MIIFLKVTRLLVMVILKFIFLKFIIIITFFKKNFFTVHLTLFLLMLLNLIYNNKGVRKFLNTHLKFLDSNYHFDVINLTLFVEFILFFLGEFNQMGFIIIMDFIHFS